MRIRRFVAAGVAALVLVGLGAAPASAQIGVPGILEVPGELPVGDPLSLVSELLTSSVLG
ncbi:MAG TPA: hypothetical protein VI076_07330 [Actinopolymorphaceae bacterium]